MQSTQFNPRRAWLDELMSRPHLWPDQLEQVMRLADEMGVKINVWRRELTMDAVWQKEHHGH